MTDIDIDAIRQRAVDDFNALYLVGSWVRYWTGTRQDPAKYGQTRSKAELLSGHTPVVWVTTHGACIALTHVDVIPGQPDDIEDDSHDLPEPARAAERVRDYIAANGDGIYDVLDGHPLYARDMEALRRAGEEVEQLRAYNRSVKGANADLREQLTAANRHADGLEADLRSANTANTAWANENARVRQQRDAQKPVVDAARRVTTAVGLDWPAGFDGNRIQTEAFTALTDAVTQLDGGLTYGPAATR